MDSMTVAPDFELLLAECTLSAVRSGGKGGQNVNKVSTKVILVFDIFNSEVLTEEQKEWLVVRLMARISKDGLIRMNSSSERTQLGNRKRVEEKFVQLMEKSFEVRKERIESRPTRASKEKRLREKKAVSVKKSGRGEDFGSAVIDE